jgi:voltage-gated potassium channel
MVDTWRRLRLAGAAFGVVLVIGTAGYMGFGLGFVDALYQTVTTVTTVGFRELKEFGPGEQLFTIALIVLGAGAALYTITLVVETMVDGPAAELLARRRRDRRIGSMKGHTIVCGVGRVGRAIARELTEAGHDVVVVDAEAERLAGLPYTAVHGDATLDSTLRAAGIMDARALVAALETDADNLFVTLSGRSLRNDLFIVARAREEESLSKLERAGADRVVNPQELGAQRMASFVAQPNVADYVDIVMHERDRALRLQEVEVPEGSPVVGRSLDQLDLRSSTGAMVFAVRSPDGSFVTNPDPELRLTTGQVLIAIGNNGHLEALASLVSG